LTCRSCGLPGSWRKT